MPCGDSWSNCGPRRVSQQSLGPRCSPSVFSNTQHDREWPYLLTAGRRRSWYYCLLCGEKLHLLSGTSGVHSADARCLDGSPAGYYLEPGSDTTRWVIWLQGGGVCSSMGDCKARTQSDLGSSTDWFKRREGGSAGDGIMSNSASSNPDFHAWSKVYIPCVSCCTCPAALRPHRRRGNW